MLPAPQITAMKHRPQTQLKSGGQDEILLHLFKIGINHIIVILFAALCTAGRLTLLGLGLG
ncbi:MAG: hypothetical protein OEY01_06225, partial [Desulfobulbaceae bacterium]|nr:hypothetical protein [Desulfobulbaceae bacterium]HIJ78707.1 hypothetical protein [Deltaproteobacteria bacterium]